MAFPQISDADTTSGVVTSNQSTWTMDYPANIAADDLLLLFIGRDGGGGGSAPPTDWSSLTGAQSSTAVYGQAFKKKATGSESGTFTINMPQGEQGGWRVFRIPASTWHGDLTNDVVGASTTGTSSTPDPILFNPAGWDVEDTLWIAACAVDTSRTISVYPLPDRNTADVSGGNAGATLGVCTDELAQASLDPGTFTVSASDEWTAMTVAVRPAAAAEAFDPSTGYPWLEQPADWRPATWFAPEASVEGLVPRVNAYSGSDLEEQPGHWQPIVWRHPDDAYEGLPPPLPRQDLTEQPAHWRIELWWAPEPSVEGLPPPTAVFDLAEQPATWQLVTWFTPEPVDVFAPAPPPEAPPAATWTEQPASWRIVSWFSPEALVEALRPPVEEHAGSAVLTGGGVVTPAGIKGAEAAVALAGGGVVTVATIKGAESTHTFSGGGVITTSTTTARFGSASLTGGGVVTVGAGVVPPVGGPEVMGAGGGARRKRKEPRKVEVRAESLFKNLERQYGRALGGHVYEAMERERKGPFGKGKKYDPDDV